jgi:hypothetical protein
VTAAATPSPLAQARNPSHHTDAAFGPSTPSREPSVNRGRSLIASGRTASPRSQTPVLLSSSTDRGLERKPSHSYGHHRQTSIVHGQSVKHSRNTSFVNSPATSPLSPQVIATSVTPAPDDGPVMSQDSITEAFAANGPQATGTTANGYTGTGATAAGTDGTASHASAARKLERMQSGRSLRKGHNHHRSQSRHQHQHEPKTVSEYALHHLFNLVSLSRPGREVAR